MSRTSEFWLEGGSSVPFRPPEVPPPLTFSPAVPQAAHLWDLGQQLAVLRWGAEHREKHVKPRPTNASQTLCPHEDLEESLTPPPPAGVYLDQLFLNQKPAIDVKEKNQEGGAKID